MEQVYEFFKNILGNTDWPARWHCGTWSDFHGWLYILSDLIIWGAYFTIPIIIFNYISRRKDVQFHKIYLLFAAFIFACGSTHFLDAVMFWVPAYRLNALVRFITAILSVLTVLALIKVLPTAFSLQSSAQLRKEAEKRQVVEDELRSINTQLNEAQELAKLGNYVWDILSGRMVWSSGMFTILDLPVHKRELSYHDFLKTVHPEDKDQVNSVLQEAISKKISTGFFYRILLADGQVKMIHARGKIVFDEKNTVKELVGTVQDVTLQKQTEEEILSTLRDRLEIEKLNEQLKKSNAELKQFAYIASHDLQEPLRKVTNYTLMLEDSLGSVDPHSQNYLTKINTSTSRMQNLIRDILAYSEVSVADKEFKQVDLVKVIEQVLIDFELLIEQKEATVEFAGLPVIEAIPLQMNQLFSNLISNSLKYSSKQRKPVIKISTGIITPEEIDTYQIAPSSSNYHKIVICDNGIGFNQLNAEDIFDIFRRLHKKVEYSGTGIGLAMCRKVTENHYGYIYATSDESGAVFNIILPKNPKNIAV